MAGVGVGELIWLGIAAFLGLGVVIAWIIKSEINRNLFRAEIQKLKSQIASVEREKFMMTEEMHVALANAPRAESSDKGASDAVIANMMAKTEELERDNARLKQELSEARSSLEEVYKALCSK